MGQQSCCASVNQNPKDQIEISLIGSPSNFVVKTYNQSAIKIDVNYDNNEQIRPSMRQLPGTSSKSIHQQKHQESQSENILNQSILNTTKGDKNLAIKWMDRNVMSGENCINLKLFKNHKLPIDDVSTLNGLKVSLQDTNKNDIVLVISSASLEKQAYDFMHEDQRIKEIILFCMSEEGAKLLMRPQNNFFKIKRFGLYWKEVVLHVKQIQREYAQKGLIDPESIIELDFQIPMKQSDRIDKMRKGDE